MQSSQKVEKNLLLASSSDSNNPNALSVLMSSSETACSRSVAGFIEMGGVMPKNFIFFSVIYEVSRKRSLEQSSSGQLVGRESDRKDE